MSYHRLEDLEVYQLADNFSNEVWDIVVTWDFFAKDVVGKQFAKAADSISANIAEGYRRFHYKENKNFCFFSRGSLLETKGWLKKPCTESWYLKNSLVNYTISSKLFTLN